MSFQGQSEVSFGEQLEIVSVHVRCQQMPEG